MGFACCLGHGRCRKPFGGCRVSPTWRLLNQKIGRTKLCMATRRGLSSEALGAKLEAPPAFIAALVVPDLAWPAWEASSFAVPVARVHLQLHVAPNNQLARLPGAPKLIRCTPESTRHIRVHFPSSPVLNLHPLNCRRNHEDRNFRSGNFL